MKKKIIQLLAAAMGVILLAGCGRQAAVTETGEPAAEKSQQAETGMDTETPSAPQAGDLEVRIGSLKGPTSMGLLYLMHQAGKGETTNQYTFSMETAADTLLPRMIKGDLDIALLPANVAAVLYQKAEGAVAVIDINTLGTLSVVSAQEDVSSIKELRGKTLYLMGKGTTPDYVLQYLLRENGLSSEDLKLEYKSEASEVVALLAQNPENFGLLPQPFATAACMKNTDLKQVADVTAEWDAVAEGGSRLVTGVTVVRREFLEQNPQAVMDFMAEHKESAAYANSEAEEAAELAADFGIVEKAEIAVKAMPECHIVYLDGSEMQKALSGYLQVLYDLNPEAVGGSMPEADFYWTAKTPAEGETALQTEAE